jgi:predicted metal-dependent HD superfamily phosphohydrolase
MEDLRGWLYTLPIDWIDGCPEQVFYEAREAYRSSGRHYHTWEHVLDCVEKLRAIPTESSRAVFLALVFHDAIYVPGRPDNEVLSAGLAADVLSEHTRLSREELEAIEKMILATRHHVPEPGSSHDLRVALDIDMSILGADRESYEAYAAGVRREWVPAVTTEEKFKAGRAAFLSKLLTSKAMFTTEEGKERWQAAARANVALEFARLTEHETLKQRFTRWVASKRG